MKLLCRNVIGSSYRHVVKPVLFHFSPDDVHYQIVQLARFAQRFCIVRACLHVMMSHKCVALEQEIHGMRFSNPVGLSAGFDKNGELEPIMQSIGFGFATVGSITGYSCSGNEKPWFHRLPESKSIVVNAGLPNRGSAVIASQLAQSRLRLPSDMPLSISIARTNSKESSTDAAAINDYILAANNLKQVADMFELNISCPNTYGGEPFTQPKRLGRLLDELQTLHLQQPVFIKMPSHLSWNEYEALLDVIVEHNIAGVTISNLRKDRTGIAIDSSVKGNLSGKPTEQQSNDLISRTYTKYGKRLTIIGVGGVFTADDAYQKIKNGASLVALVTGLIYEGPQLVGTINYGLERLLRADGYTHINQAVGVAAGQIYEHK